MICKCGKETRVVETRSHKGHKYRRRKCSCGQAFYTKEITCKDFPYRDKGNTYKIKGKVKPKPKKEKVKPVKPEEPTLQFNGIPVTKDSPDWLKRVAQLIK